MSSVLQIQPATTSNVIAFDRPPVRKRSLAIALAVGLVIGTLFSLQAADSGSSDLSGDEVKTEIVVP